MWEIYLYTKGGIQNIRDRKVVNMIYLSNNLLKAGDQVEKGMESATKDIVKEVKEFLDFFDGNMLGEIITKILFAIIVYFIGRKLVKVVKKIVDRSLKKSNFEQSVSKFLLNLTSIGLNAILIVIIVGILGVPTSSFVAIIGSAGLAIGLSLQGSLANFAGGVLILILKPFRVNDYIVSSGIEGKVTEIDIFYTKLITPDNQKVVIPNGILANSSIKNVPDEDYRRLDLIIPVDYSSDIKSVRSALNVLANSDNRIIKENGKNVDILVESFGESAINIAFRVWVETADFFAVKFDIQEKIIEKFRKEGINIPYNKIDINISK
ncbi:MAG: mechanosensitive ion channel [Lachnospiraceae bacterium]|nr:mechanosensitive ion channel [Lachnospiraceae bacterium]